MSISMLRPVCIWLAGLGFALAPFATAFTQDGLVDLRVQLKWFHQFQFAGYYAAIEQGYFRDVGLNVTLIEGGPAVTPTDVVLAGDAEFGIGTSGLLVSHSRGRPVVAIAAIFQHSPYILLARNDPEIRSVRDLAGRRVMVEPYAEELIAFLHREGVSINDIVAIEHSGNALRLGDDDVAAMTAYTSTEPFILDEAGIPYQRFDPKVAGIDFYGDTVFTSEAFARENEQVVIAFRDALLEGWRYALGNQDEVINLIHERYGSELSRTHERFAANDIRRLLIPDMVDIGYMNRERWERIAAEFQSAGLLEGPVDLDRFLFTPNLQADWTWVYGALLLAAFLIAVVSIALGKFYALNHSLRAEIRVRRGLENELKALAVTDPGTGVLNRRGFMHEIEAALDRAAGVGSALTLLIVDIDHFKSVNDTHGHAAGDHVLAEFAQVCRRILREGDTIGRLGGEEFAILLPDVALEGAQATAERIRRMVEGLVISLPRSGDFSVTVSIGLAVHQRDEALDALMSRADGAMYEAKCLGRNRVVVAAALNQTARLKQQRARHGESAREEENTG
jgi:diguanylate cyclase (GGDEF)-like protein